MNKTNVKPFVFVLMPFHPDFDDIYQLGIKAACVSVGAYCERVDEQIFVENILDRVYNQIAKADIVISEMTGRNPNVFYETGYAHALNKRVILLTQNTDDIPFDLKHYPHIVYGGKIAQLKTELEKRTRWYIDNPADSIVNTDLDFEFLINGVIWQEGLELEIPCDVELKDKYGDVIRNVVRDVTRVNRYELQETNNVLFSLQVVSHNTSNVVIHGDRYRLRLITPNTFTPQKYINSTPNGQSLAIRLESFGILFPDDWYSTQIDLKVSRQNPSNLSAEFVLKVFSVLGPKDYKFKIYLVPTKFC